MKTAVIQTANFKYISKTYVQNGIDMETPDIENAHHFLNHEDALSFMDAKELSWPFACVKEIETE